MVGADRSRPQLLRLFQEASGKEVVVRAALQGDVVSNDLPQSLSGEKIAIRRPVTHLVTGNLHRVTRARARSTPCFEKRGSLTAATLPVGTERLLPIEFAQLPRTIESGSPSSSRRRSNSSCSARTIARARANICAVAISRVTDGSCAPRARSRRSFASCCRRSTTS